MAFGFLISILYITASNASAYDYSKWESTAEKTLLDPKFDSGIISADVSINPELVTFNCTTDISLQEINVPSERFRGFLATIIGVYRPIAAFVPEVGDLLVSMKNLNQSTTITLSCPKSRVGDPNLMNDDDTIKRV